jgi:hypothetical protein
MLINYPFWNKNLLNTDIVHAHIRLNVHMWRREEREKENTNHMSMLFRRQKKKRKCKQYYNGFLHIFAVLPDGEYQSIIITRYCC